jgi:hypothetical protein
MGANTGAINSVLCMAQMLGSEPAIFGPSMEQIQETEGLARSLKEETKLANAMFVFAEKIRSNVENGKTDMLAEDAPEMLQISNGLLINRIKNLNEQYSRVSAFPIFKARKVEVQNLTYQVCNILHKSCYELMELKQFIMHARGQTTSFRASKNNLEAIVKAALNTDAKEGADFVEI